MLAAYVSKYHLQISLPTNVLTTYRSYRYSNNLTGHKKQTLKRKTYLLSVKKIYAWLKVAKWVQKSVHFKNTSCYYWWVLKILSIFKETLAHNRKQFPTF